MRYCIFLAGGGIRHVFFLIKDTKDIGTRFLQVVFFSLFLSTHCFSQAVNQYFIQNSTVRFVSNASLERIEAVSVELRGIIDVSTNSFAFSVNNTSFKGFNSPLQEEHFNENYVESGKYPKCTFIGKIIEAIDFGKDGVYVVRAKGMFNIKGVSQERIINCNVTVKDNEIYISSDFVVLLADHDIRIPRIVQQKIAPEVTISIKAKLTGGKKK